MWIFLMSVIFKIKSFWQNFVSFCNSSGMQVLDKHLKQFYHKYQSFSWTWDQTFLSGKGLYSNILMLSFMTESIIQPCSIFVSLRRFCSPLKEDCNFCNSSLWCWILVNIILFFVFLFVCLLLFFLHCCWLRILFAN